MTYSSAVELRVWSNLGNCWHWYGEILGIEGSRLVSRGAGQRQEVEICRPASRRRRLARAKPCPCASMKSVKNAGYRLPRTGHSKSVRAAQMHCLPCFRAQTGQV